MGGNTLDISAMANDDRDKTGEYLDAAARDTMSNYVAATRKLDWRAADLRGCNFTGNNMENIDFRGADLRGVNFLRCNLRYADMRGAKVQGANFQGASLYGAKCQGVEAQGADFRHADLRQANFAGAYTEGMMMPQTGTREQFVSPGDIAEDHDLPEPPGPERGNGQDHGRGR
jgi:uncharacterized protein YjbI with pentapeptide repeats